ncbi:MAG: DUF3575 domain-containing protein [Bacteroidales bacterium]|nr:DUF3575 domain-containing protein [Bacteroidales bacterium]
MIRTNKTHMAVNAAAKLAVRLLFVLVAFFFTRANALAQDSAARVFFPVDKWSVNAAYLNNADALAAAEEIAARCAEDSSLALEIISYSSPEGNVYYNQYLSEKRSAALRDYLLAKYPKLWGRVFMNPNAEAWDDLREAVVSDERLDETSRTKLLAILDKDITSDEKEAQLRQQPAFSLLYRNFFKYFRYAEVSLKQIAPSTEESQDRYNILFPLNSAEVDATFADNAQVLADLDEFLSGRNADRLTKLRIISGSSIDGPVALNKAIAQRRGDALKQYIESKYPKLSGLIVVESQGEAWDELRESVKNADNLTAIEKYELLKTIDNPNLSAQAKEAALRQNAAWNRILEDVLPQTRFASVVPEYESVDTAAPALPDTLAHARDTMERALANEDSTAVKAVDTVAAVNPVDTLVPGLLYPQTDTTAVAATDSIAITVTDADAVAATDTAGTTATEVYTKERRPLFAISNNLLYESATVFTGFHSVPLNIGVEVPIGQHFSVFANYMATAPWRAWNSNADCAELLHADLGARWYPGGTFANPFKPKANRELLDGWYAYASLGAGYYDFERNGRGYQGEEILGTLGIGYGLTLGHDWSLDFAVGGGPLFTQYRYYVGRSNNEHLVYQYSGKLTYFGVTDAKVSLRYLIHYNKKVKVQ